MADYPGGETVAILAEQSSGTTDLLGQSVKQKVAVAYVYGCVFEPYSRGPVEEQTDTITNHERAWAFLPYVAGIGIPTVDSSGNAVLDTNGNPVAVTINNDHWIQPQRPYDAQSQRDYKVQGLPELEYDSEGMPDHMWVTCEWQGG